MADEGIFATTLEVQRKAGANASSVAIDEAYINDFMTQAESDINASVRFNFSDAYAGLNVDVQGWLKQAASNQAAIYVINYDMDAIGRSTAQSRINVLRDNFLRIIQQLKDRKHQTFIKNA